MQTLQQMLHSKWKYVLFKVILNHALTRLNTYNN